MEARWRLMRYEIMVLAATGERRVVETCASTERNLLQAAQG